MKRKIVTIEGELYLMDFDNYTFLKVERLVAYDFQMTPRRFSPEHYNFEENKFTFSSYHELTIFCCIVGEEEEYNNYTQCKYVKKIKKWGCVNQNKEEIILCIYDDIEFCGGLFLEATMSDLIFLMDNEGVPLQRYGSGETYKEIRFYGYQAIGQFSNGLAIGIKDGHQGIVRWDGRVFLEPEYDYIDRQSIGKKYIIAKKGDEDVTILYYENQKCWCYLSKDYSFLKYDDKEKYFIVKKLAGKEFNQTMTVEHFKESIGTKELVLKGNEDAGKAGLMYDDTGNVVGGISHEITKPEDIVSPMIGIGQDGRAVFYNQEDKIGVINSSGEMFIPSIYSDLKYDILKKLFIVKKEDKVGALDSFGKTLIPLIYTNLVIHKDIIIATNSQGKKGILGGSDYKTILLDFEYDDIYSRKIDFYYSSSNLILTKNNLQGLCNANGKILFEPIIKKDIYIYPDTYGESLIGFRKGNKDGFINLKGESVLLFDKDKIKYGFTDGETRITNESGWKIINKQGKVLDEGEYPRDWGYTNEELDRDTWDALTDGQYDDYPEDGYDVSDLLDSMGRG